MGTKVKNKKVIVLSCWASWWPFIAAGVFGVVTLCNSWLEDLPDYQNADAYNTAQPTMVYASDGTTLLAEFQLENRDPVALDQISEYVLKGTVATEDERFYTHSGVDYLGVARALVNNLMAASWRAPPPSLSSSCATRFFPTRCATSPSSAKSARCTFPRSWKSSTPKTRSCSCT